MEEDQDQAKIAGIAGGIFFICVGICALIYPGFFATYETLGRFGLIKAFLREYWGQPFGLALLVLGILSLVVVKITSERQR